jgi:hypothetical protein
MNNLEISKKMANCAIPIGLPTIIKGFAKRKGY